MPAADPPSYTCPHCGSVSYHPKDVAEKYCARCKAFVLDVDAATAFALGFVVEPGTLGTLTRGQAPGAIPNGGRVRKVHTEPGDTFPDGTLGTVLGSFRVPEHGLAYFIRFDPQPDRSVFIQARRIEAATGGG